MALPATFTGASKPPPGYEGIERELFTAVDKVNGNVLVPDAEGGMRYPALSNSQAAAIVRAWQRAAARSKAPAWPLGYDLTLAALGWRREGDKFVMTDAHRQAPAPVELIGLLWRSVRTLAGTLDASGTKLAPLIVDWSKGGYEAAARDAWRKMQEDRGKTAPVSAPAVRDSSGWGGSILLIALLIAVAGSRKG